MGQIIGLDPGPQPSDSALNIPHFLHHTPLLPAPRRHSGVRFLTRQLTHTLGNRITLGWCFGMDWTPVASKQVRGPRGQGSMTLAGAGEGKAERDLYGRTSPERSGAADTRTTKQQNPWD